jgi:hypothetical protein
LRVDLIITSPTLFVTCNGEHPFLRLLLNAIASIGSLQALQLPQRSRWSPLAMAASRLAHSPGRSEFWTM